MNEQLIEAYMGWHGFDRERAIEEIKGDTPKQRLATYLEWNGIIGFAETAYLVATQEPDL